MLSRCRTSHILILHIRTTLILAIKRSLLTPRLRTAFKSTNGRVMRVAIPFQRPTKTWLTFNLPASRADMEVGEGAGCIFEHEIAVQSVTYPQRAKLQFRVSR